MGLVSYSHFRIDRFTYCYYIVLTLGKKRVYRRILEYVFQNNRIGLVVMMSDFQSVDPGSNPGCDIFYDVEMILFFLRNDI